VGQAVLQALLDAGYSVRALHRKQFLAPRPGVEWVSGDLENRAALKQLVAGTSAVIHVAGAIKARTRADFVTANSAGTGHLIGVARSTDVNRFIHISSLAAREPHLSDYAFSKAGAEALVQGSALAWTILRPPAVYGPGDRETLAFFKAARMGVAPLLAPQARVSLIHVFDLAQAVLATLRSPMVTSRLLEPDDGQPGGYRLDELMTLIAAAMNRPAPRFLPVPAWLVSAAGWANAAVSRLSGTVPMLAPGKVNELLHPDWVSQGAPGLDWTARYPAAIGLAATADWYKQAGWL
jgi:UDP-glucose 4-epimerase